MCTVADMTDGLGGGHYEGILGDRDNFGGRASEGPIISMWSIMLTRSWRDTKCMPYGEQCVLDELGGRLAGTHSHRDDHSARYHSIR